MMRPLWAGRCVAAYGWLGGGLLAALLLLAVVVCESRSEWAEIRGLTYSDLAVLTALGLLLIFGSIQP